MKFTDRNLRYYVIGGDRLVEQLFQFNGFIPVDGMKDADIVIFTGGADVSPDLYGETANRRTSSSPRRDEFELACYKMTAGKLRVGICRGGQFLNVMNGGKMFQHVDGHGGTHPTRYEYFEKERTVFAYYNTTSTHHQMMKPNLKVGQVWAVANQTTFREGGLNEKGVVLKTDMREQHWTDVEVCWYPTTRSLCFQPHPEYSSVETKTLFFNCLERALTV